MKFLQIAYLSPAVFTLTLVVILANIPTVRLKPIAPTIQAFGLISPVLVDEKRQIQRVSEKFAFQSSHGAKYANNDELLSDGSST